MDVNKVNNEHVYFLHTSFSPFFDRIPLDFEDTLSRLKKKEFECWMVSEYEEVMALCITRITKDTLVIEGLAGGEGASLPSLHQRIKEDAIKRGCKELVIAGRKGSIRI